MSRTRSIWLWSVLSAMIAGGLGVTINIATELKTSLLAWILVGAFTLAAGAATAGTQLLSQHRAARRPSTATGPRADFSNHTDINMKGNRNKVGSITVNHSRVNGWLVFLVLGVSSTAMVAILVAINLVSPRAESSAQQRPPLASSTEAPPVLAASASWPLITGCDAQTQVAMPAGHGGVHDFHADTDVRSTLAASGAGSWINGLLYVDLSTVNGKSVHIQNILPKRLRRDLASPAWIYAPDDGCGQPPESRVFSYNLDTGAFKDEGTPYGDPSHPSPGIPTAQLGPGFVLSGPDHALIQISASSCHGNYEWNLDIQYVVTGTDKVEHYIAGPFQSFGAANNTTVYRGHQDNTGGIQIDDISNLTGKTQNSAC